MKIYDHGQFILNRIKYCSTRANLYQTFPDFEFLIVDDGSTDESRVTDQDVSERLHVSKRTLQEYRTTGKIPYILLGVRCCISNRILNRCLKRRIVGRGYDT